MQQLRESVRLLAELIGRLQTGTVINLQVNIAYLQVKETIRDALRRHPQARFEVMQAIERSERFNGAR
jgi:hypothetical protein